ncbi:MAG: hypothetical protein M8866_08980 [marine benthic group bacterium]|nr:hypothetical protein [Candidatus Benthicola marisminoris]
MRFSLAGATCLLAAACVSTNVTPVDTTARASRPLDSVEVLEEPPSEAYTVIATIEAGSDFVFDSFDDIRNEMVAQAAELGGDALIVGPDSTETRFILTGTAMIQSDSRRLLGKVIVYEGG